MSTVVSSPWQRRLPRIATTEKNEQANTVLNVGSYGGTKGFLQIRNFTLGGLLLEYKGAELSNVKIGTRFLFDILASNGDKLTDVEGMVMHISEDLNTLRPESQHFQFGIKFTNMNMVNEAKYKAII